jgi:hypothetical protein
VCEVCVLQEVAHVGDVLREPEVVIGEVAHDLAPRLFQGGVTIRFSVPRAFGIVEESHPLVLTQLAHDLAGDVRHAVADDEQLYLLDGLCENATSRVQQQRTVVVGRNEYGRF